MKRMTLVPPAVEPEQPPMTMAASRRTWVTGSQTSKSAVAKPVVVMIETTWKAEVRIASGSGRLPSGSITRKTVMASVKPASSR